MRISAYSGIAGMLGIFAIFTNKTIASADLHLNEIIATLIFLLFTLCVLLIFLENPKISWIRSLVMFSVSAYITDRFLESVLEIGWHTNEMMALACTLGVALFIFCMPTSD